VLTPFTGLSRDLGRADCEYLMCERTATALAATLRQLLASAELRNTIAQQGYDWACRTMSLERSLDRYAALYHELAAARRRV
jgi:glycosyltransferase involved in cell wall biosynthesis